MATMVIVLAINFSIEQCSARQNDVRLDLSQQNFVGELQAFSWIRVTSVYRQPSRARNTMVPSNGSSLHCQGTRVEV